jgi:cytochrome d ubiquinol oxidase subunit II
LQDDFRKRALLAGVAVGLLALLVFLLSGEGAPSVRAGLSRSRWAVPLHAATALCATGAFWSLWKRAYRWARWCAAGQVTLILWGWALAQFPYIVEPDITIHSAAAPDATLRLLLAALALGALLLFPSFYYLFRVFKSNDERQG